MGQSIIQTSFNSGEWAPALNARVDLQKYHSGAALLRNFFIDYRGGATARGGTRYILQTKSTGTVRLIPFQASFSVSYVLEFGQGYLRFYNNGAPVLESPTTISGATQANPGVIHDVAHGYATGDWVFVQNIVGMTQLNGNYYIVVKTDADHYSLTDLNGVAINTSTFTAYISGGTAQRVYTIISPYQANELKQIKFIQDVNILILTHPNYTPYSLTLNSATNWTLNPITFGSTIPAPIGLGVGSTLAAGTVNYAYIITAVDINGQESEVSAFATLSNVQDIRTTSGTNAVSWAAVTGAVSYNVYKAEPRYTTPVPAGSQFGFAGNCTGTNFTDSNISQDFSQGPPIAQNPFFGSGVLSVKITAPGAYLFVPTVAFGAGSPTAIGSAILGATAAGVANGGTNYNFGDLIFLANGLVLIVNGIGPLESVTNVLISSVGSIPSGYTPSNPVNGSTSGLGTGATFNVTWGVIAVTLTSPGAGYAVAPAVTFPGGVGSGATATATLGAPSSGNPTVPTFFDQRLYLMGPVGNPQQFDASQPGSPYNFDTTNPAEPDNAIEGTLVSGELNTIQSAIGMPQGLIVFSDKQAWLINGGSPGSPASATQIAANAQAYNGASYQPPIVANDNILYVQSKGSIVRDLVFNYYTQVYTGTDISVLSSHLFYGFQIVEWAWAEEPFKLVWAVRNDGQLLCLTFLKEQELVAWAHSDTQGLFKSICTVVETVAVGSVDAIYTVVQRTINGNTVQYVERMAELYYPNGTTDAWCVDCGIQYNGIAALTFSGAQQLVGATVTGLATDDLGNVTVIAPFVMPASGTFTLPAPTPVGSTGYTRVTVGLSYLPQLQTLQLDIGEPTIQGTFKQISAVTVRCNQTLGLSIGRTFGTLVTMKDLELGQVGSATNTVVTGLVTGDARTVIDAAWTIPGQYCIQQSNPYPVSILGVIPEITTKREAKQ